MKITIDCMYWQINNDKELLYIMYYKHMYIMKNNNGSETSPATVWNSYFYSKYDTNPYFISVLSTKTI